MDQDKFCKLEDKFDNLKEQYAEIRDKQDKLETENIDFRQGLTELMLGQRIQVQLFEKLEVNVSKLSDTVSSLDVMAHRMDSMEDKQDLYDKKLEDSFDRFEKNVTDKHAETISKFEKRDGILINIVKSLFIIGVIATITVVVNSYSDSKNTKYLQGYKK